MTQPTTGPAVVEPKATNKRQDRSPKFPFISLAKAVGRAEAFYRQEGKNPATKDVTISHWGYSPKSGPGLRTLGAMRAYGLMEADSNGRFKLTAAALRIILDTDRESELKKAALHPSTFQKIWNAFGIELPSDKSLKAKLVLDEHFTDSAAEDFIAAYKETISFAGLREADNVSGSKRDKCELQVGDYVQWTSQGVDQFKEAKRIREIVGGGKFVLLDGHATGVPIEEVAKCEMAVEEGQEGVKSQGHVLNAMPRRVPPKPGMNNDVFTLDEGEVILQWPSRMTKESFEDFEEWLRLVVRKAKRTILNDDDRPNTE